MKMPLWMVCFIVAAEMLVILVFVPGRWTEQVIAREAQMIERHLGAEARDYVKARASGWYHASVIHTGIYPSLHRLLIPSAEEAQRSRGMQRLGAPLFAWLEERLGALMQVIYQIYTRFALLTLWLPYMALLLVPALLDGYLRRRIKLTNFDYASPFWNRYGLRGVLLIGQGVLIAFIAPVALNPALLPVVMMLVCVLLGVFVGNLQKRV